MAVVPQLEAELVSRNALSRAEAANLLSRPPQPASVLSVVVIVVCLAGAFGFDAVRGETVFRALVGAAAGGALALALLAYRELRSLRRQVHALHVLSTGDEA